MTAQTPAQGVPDTLRALATHSLSTLLLALNALGLVALGLTLILAPPAYSQPLRMPAAGALWLIAAGGVTAFHFLGPRLRAQAWAQKGLSAIPVAMSLAALGTLAFVRTKAHLEGPWPIELQAGALLSVTLVGTVGLGRGMLGTVVVAGAAARVAMTSPIADSIARGPLLAALPLTMLVIITVTTAVLIGLLRQNAQRLDARLRALDARRALAAAITSADSFAAEVTRSLHDSALNTLEAITLSGPSLAPELVRQRASADARAIGDWLEASGGRPLGHLAHDLTEHANHLGLTVRWDLCEIPPDTSQPPAGVVGALRGAGYEALTNVAKHAGVAAATATLSGADDGGLVLRIDDSGRGIKSAQVDPFGFGTSQSIAGRMAAVGGTGQVLPKKDGGTSVILRWSPSVAADEPSTATTLLQLGGQAVAAATIGAALLSVGLTLLLPGSFRSPGAALLAALLAAAMAGHVALGSGVWRAQTRDGGRQRAGSDAALVALTYLCALGLMLQADPLCVSALALPLAPRPEILLLVALVIRDARQKTIAVALVTVAAGVFGAILLPGTAGCAANSSSDGLTATIALVVFALFARTTLRLGRAHALSRRLTRDLITQAHEAVLVGAERREWLAEAIERSQALLTRLATGEASPADPEVRRECRREAALLRAILVAGSATPENRRHLRCQLNRIVEGGHLLAAKGDFRALDPPVYVIDELREWARAAGRAPEVPLQVTLFAWAAGGEQGLSVLAEPVAEGEVTGFEPELSWEWVVAPTEATVEPA